MKVAKPGDTLRSGAQHEVIGVAENDVRACGFDVVDEHGFDGRGGADRHEGGGSNDTARRCNLAKARIAVIRQELEGEGCGHSTGSIARRSRDASP